ncbi:MAG: hypothetical protein QHH15_05325 [Candidatus Thermoplasmatota archaeon]|jgi:hypothetical protein|nr:hypothetical protein [Candidatus Thermoplasmatota archaeon]
MDETKNPDTDLKSNNIFEKENLQLPTQTISQRNILPTIAGFLLIIAGFFAIINWISIFLLDINTLNIYYDISQLQQIYPNITIEQFLDFLKACASIGIVISIFPILGGILALKRKMWGISVTCSIIGLISIGILFTSSIFSFIAIIILFISKKEFQ